MIGSPTLHPGTHHVISVRKPAVMSNVKLTYSQQIRSLTSIKRQTRFSRHIYFTPPKHPRYHSILHISFSRRSIVIKPPTSRWNPTNSWPYGPNYNKVALTPEVHLRDFLAFASNGELEVFDAQCKRHICWLSGCQRITTGNNGLSAPAHEQH